MNKNALAINNGANNSNLHTQNKFKVSDVLIKGWTYWMASEVINLLQNQYLVSINADLVMEALELEKERGFSKLLTEIIDKKQELENDITAKDLAIVKNSLDIYYHDTIFFKIQELSQKLQTESTSLLRNLLNVQFAEASPKNLLDFLKQLIKKLISQRGKSETKKIWYVEREKSAWHAFDKLYQYEELEQNNTSMKNAIDIAFEAKLEAEKYEQMSFVIFELIKVCQTYSSHVNQSFILLEHIKNSLKDKNSLNISVSIPVFSLLNKIDSKEQEKLLEIWLGGHKLNYWGDSPASWQQIEAKLLSNLEPIMLSIFAEFEAAFIEHLT
ncbi:MAG: hypothetical protein KME09_00100 [Pleurocapsa minor HA4230-MV1]|jgi:hypothetical protein|nr:hypothetical protein [Pleurocapsa minor HA4230-MV1]